MISLNKLEKPKILEDRAEEWTKLYEAYKKGDDSISKSITTKYSHVEVKETLVKETFGKCAYCESKILHISFGDIEHILPKSEVIDKAFEWENLTLACSVCNNNKRDYYDESNLLLDPYIDNPNKHLYFVGPLLMELSDKGTLTRIKLDLNRAELLESRTRYLDSLRGFTLLVQKTKIQELREELLKDFKKRAESSQEYSKMISDFIAVFESKLFISTL